jgi:hypothetical protein
VLLDVHHGLLCGLLDSALNDKKRQMWLGMCQVAQEQDINLLYIAGGRSDTPRPVTYGAFLKALMDVGIQTDDCLPGSQRQERR